MQVCAVIIKQVEAAIIALVYHDQKNKIKSNQIKSNQIKSNQIKPTKPQTFEIETPIK